MKRESFNENRKLINNFLVMSLSILGLFVILSAFSQQINAQVYIYEDSNYEGKRKIIRQDTPWIGDDFNDMLSSLTVPSGWEVILYEHSNYEGRSKTFQQNTSWVGDDFNDIASSLRIRKIQKSVDVKFENQTRFTVSIYWVSDSETIYNDLKGNSFYSQQTYVGHRWRVRLKGKIIGDYVAKDLSSQIVSIISENVEAGPIWDQQDAEKKCNNLANSKKRVWTGEWVTTEAGKMSMCELARLVTD